MACAVACNPRRVHAVGNWRKMALVDTRETKANEGMRFDTKRLQAGRVTHFALCVRVAIWRSAVWHGREHMDGASLAGQSHPSTIPSPRSRVENRIRTTASKSVHQRGGLPQIDIRLLRGTDYETLA